ncbi:HAD-IIA family hydrolase [Halogeometricum borinquense]|uniref:HAD-IIA family hydrolase n=1 Tax=Halogeometricum borinquense TaxID=60847 RepID=A0A482TDC3_9EURY|nr:HAD-IIA family hydrolase [Halogeometricum borinquense]RYJ14306.1 HAD-IIA family hydrolase [Halogeometricum borinquense]
MIATQFDVFLIGLDGVLSSGDEVLSNAVTTVNRLYDQDKQIRFLTNDPRPTRDTIVTRLRDFGIEVTETEIITSAWATAAFLDQQDISTTAVVGSEGLRSELCDAGIDITDDAPEVVVVGADEQTTYLDIQRAARHIDQGAQFVATNSDGAFSTPDGPAPGAGAIVRAVEATVETVPTVIGKPEPLMFEMALDEIAADQQAVVVGDNPATDILGAHRAGLPGVLVADEQHTAPSDSDFRQPDATIGTLAELFTDVTAAWESPQYSWPDEIRPGVGAVVVNETDEVLLVRRADNERWALPTGTVERGEAVDEAIIREMREETGLQISVEQLTGVYSRPHQQVFSYPSGRAVHFITNCFLCTIDAGTLAVDTDEVLEINFFGSDDLPADILPMHPRWIVDAIESGAGAAIR